MPNDLKPNAAERKMAREVVDRLLDVLMGGEALGKATVIIAKALAARREAAAARTESFPSMHALHIAQAIRNMES